MSHINAARIKGLRLTTGTADFRLDPTVLPGFRRFQDVMRSTDTCFYRAVNAAQGEWECGIGIYNRGSTLLERDHVQERSNRNRKVSFTSAPVLMQTLLPYQRRDGPPRYIPKSSQFTLYNTGSYTLTDEPAGVVLSAGSSNIGLEITQTTTPYTLDVELGFNGDGQTGIYVRDSSTGNAKSLMFAFNPSPTFWAIVVQDQTADFTFRTNGTFNTLQQFPPFYRMRDDGTNRTFYYSMNGWAWDEYGRASRTDWTATPDRIGVLGRSNVIVRRWRVY